MADPLDWHNDSRQGKRSKQARYEFLRKALFKHTDLDGSRIVSRQEFVRALTDQANNLSSIWQGLTLEQANRIFDDVTTGRGNMSLAKLDGYLVRSAVSRSISLYREAKGDESKQLNEADFVAFMVSEGVSKRSAAKLWDNVDTNRNGQVNLPEFRDWASGLLKVAVIEDIFQLSGIDLDEHELEPFAATPEAPLSTYRKSAGTPMIVGGFAPALSRPCVSVFR